MDWKIGEKGKNRTLEKNYAIGNGQNFEEGAWLLSTRSVPRGSLGYFVIIRSLGMYAGMTAARAKE